MAELTHVITRRLQSGEWNTDKFFEELADLEITLEQLKIIYAMDIDDKYNSELVNVSVSRLNAINSRLGNERTDKINRTIKRMEGK
jgi:hypothetical protein